MSYFLVFWKYDISGKSRLHFVVCPRLNFVVSEPRGKKVIVKQTKKTWYTKTWYCVLWSRNFVVSERYNRGPKSIFFVVFILMVISGVRWSIFRLPTGPTKWTRYPSTFKNICGLSFDRKTFCGISRLYFVVLGPRERKK